MLKTLNLIIILQKKYLNSCDLIFVLVWHEPFNYAYIFHIYNYGDPLNNRNITLCK